MMKWLLVTVFCVSVVAPLNAYSADGSHGPGGTSTGGGATGQSKDSRFFEFLSSCMAGRPGFESLIPGSDSSIGSTGGGASGIAGSSGGGAGSDAFASKCLRCHASGSAPDLTNLTHDKALEAIRRMDLPGDDPQHMPKGGVLSEADKSAIKAFLATK